MKTAPRISRAMICLAMIWLTMASVPVWGAVHSIEIHETAGAATRNYPVQIGRPFLQGEIAHFPMAILDGAPVFTQADVKQRWPDGSVKHAILSFLIPELKSGAKVKVTFQDQTGGNNTAILDKNLML